MIRDCRSINRFFTKQWGLAETPTVEELFNKVTGFGFGSPDTDSDKPDLPLDDIRFHDELEAAKLSHLQKGPTIPRTNSSLDDEDELMCPRRAKFIVDYSI